MNQPTLCQRPLYVCLGGVLLSFSALLYAVDGSDHLNVPDNPLPDYRSAQPNDAFQLPPLTPFDASAPSATTDGSAGFNLKRVIFRGNTVFQTNELEAITAPYLQRHISQADLEDLRQKLTRHYVDRGYVNSGVLLNPQTQSDEAVFDVVEGRLTSIQLHGQGRLDERYVTGRLAKKADGPLNIDRLRERYLLLLDDPLISHMNARLLPDDRPGTAILDIDLERARPYHLSFFANNYRPPSIGSEAIGVSGWVRNLTGYGDVLDASWQDSASHGGSPRTSLGWHIPINQMGTRLSMQVDHGRSSVVEEPMQSLDIKSTLDSREIGLDQTLIESLTHKLSLGLSTVSRQNQTWLLGVPYSFNPGEPSGVTDENLQRFWQEYAYRSEIQVLVLRSTFTSGSNNVQDIAGLPPNALPPNKYNIWLGQAQYARQVLGNGAQVIVRATIQQTSDKLLALDGMAIGGIASVRGFRENQLIRDNGEIVNIEFEYPVNIRGVNGLNGLKLALIPFYDSGRGWNKGDSSTTLSSLGLATRLKWKNFNLDMAIAKRLQSSELVKSDSSILQDKGVHFQASYQY